VDFEVYASLRGTYETGLTAPVVSDEGTLPGRTIQGVQVEGGAYGSKTFKRSSLGLDYRGDYRQTNLNAFNGTNQALSLDVQGTASRRLVYFARQTAGTTNRAFGGFSAPAFVDQDNLGVPLNEVFDSRVYFSQTSGGLGYMKSARTTIRISGDGFFIKRTSRALVGMQGYRAGVDVSRRMSRSTTVGAAYNYLDFMYPRAYGGSHIHMAILRLERRLSRNVDLSTQLGLFRSDTTGTQQITLSPEIAAILGRATGVEAFRRIKYGPYFAGSVNYTLERSRFTGSASIGVRPGNGVYLTSRADTINFGYSYAGIRRLSLGASAGYSRTRSLGLSLRDFNTVQGGGGLTYTLARFVGFTMQVDRRNFSAPGLQGRTGTSFVAGISFSSSTLPLAIW
jgi:hypothetical protein